MAIANTPGLMNAYNALFANTPQGAMMRRRVRLGLASSPGGQRPVAGGAPVPNVGTVTSNPFPDAGGAPGGPPSRPSPVGAPGGGVPGGGVPGSGMGPTSGRSGWSFSGPTATAWGGYGKTAGTIVGGPIGAIAGWAAGRGLGSIRDNQFYRSFMPGYGIPRFMSGSPVSSGPNYGGFDPTSMGVQGGQAGYQGGGPDERGGFGAVDRDVAGPGGGPGPDGFGGGSQSPY